MDFPPAIRALHNYQQYIINNKGNIPRSRLEYYIKQSKPYDTTEDDVSRLIITSIHTAFEKITSYATAYAYARFLKYAHPLILMALYIPESPIHLAIYVMAYVVICSMKRDTKISSYLECSLIATNNIPLKLKKDYPGLVDLWQKQNDLFQSKKQPWGMFYFRLLALSPNIEEDGSGDMTNALRVIYEQCRNGKQNTADLLHFYWQIYLLLKHVKMDSDEWRHYKNIEKFLVLFCQQYAVLNSESEFNLILETADTIRHIAEQLADGASIDSQSLLYMQQLDWDIFYFESDPCMIEPHASYLTEEFRINYMSLLINERALQDDKDFCIEYLTNLVFSEDEDKDFILKLNETRGKCIEELKKFKTLPPKKP